VGIATIYRWVSRKKEKGNVEPLRRPYVYKKINDQKLIDYVERNPDHFLSEIGNYFNLTPQAIFYALKRLKITRKKIHAVPRKRRRKRANFITSLEKIPPEQRIYLDESGINQYLHREYGRSIQGKK
jgi:transposase